MNANRKVDFKNGVKLYCICIMSNVFIYVISSSCFMKWKIYSNEAIAMKINVP